MDGSIGTIPGSGVDVAPGSNLLIPSTLMSKTVLRLGSRKPPTLYSFLRLYFRPPLTSAAHTRRVVRLSHVRVNGIPEMAESRRLVEGDVIQLYATPACIERAMFSRPLLRTLLANSEFIVLLKPPGMPVSGQQHDALPNVLPSSLPVDCDKSHVVVVASVGRAIYGPVVVALNPSAEGALRQSAVSGLFLYQYHVVVHGTPPSALPGLSSFVSLNVLRITQSTVGPLTSLELILTSNDSGIRRAFLDAGTPVLGNGALTRPSKTTSSGIFMACTAVSFPSPSPAAPRHSIDLPLPDKFPLQLAKEARCAEMKAVADANRSACAGQVREFFSSRISPPVLEQFVGVEYVTFCNVPLIATGAVMDPRPCSSLLVSAAVAMCPERVLDLGTGSGALLMATMLTSPGRPVGVGLDISRAALDVARVNIRAHGLESRAALVQGQFSCLGDCCNALCGASKGFDVILCNPPYLTPQEVAMEVQDLRGPDIALVAGDVHLDLDTTARSSGRGRGLACYKDVAIGIGNVDGILLPGGQVVVELGGKRDADAVVELFETHASLSCREALRDTNGFTRCLIFSASSNCLKLRQLHPRI